MTARKHTRLTVTIDVEAGSPLSETDLPAAMKRLVKRLDELGSDIRAIGVTIRDSAGHLVGSMSAESATNANNGR